MDLVPLNQSMDNDIALKHALNSGPQEEAVRGIVRVDQPNSLFHEVHQYDDVEADDIVEQTEDGDFVVGTEDYGDSEIPYAEATLEPLPSQEQTEENHCENNDVAAQPIVESSTPSSVLRPEFIYATAIKPSPHSSIGLTFKKKNNGVYISKVDQEGLFHKSGLQPGDRVVAVNNISCIEASLRAVRDMIMNAKLQVSICVRNKHGDPNSVLNSIQKPNRECKLGICFQMRRGALTVSKVREDGLFAESLLMPDHRCFMINGQLCDNMGSQEAANLTADTDRVTIISRARGDHAIVLCVGEARRWSALALGAGVAAATLSAIGSMS